MKNKLAQFVTLVARIDHRYIQMAYFAVAVFGLVVLRSPSDGGTGPS